VLVAFLLAPQCEGVGDHHPPPPKAGGHWWPRISRDRAIARSRAAPLSAENVEAVATLDLYSQYDQDLAERERCRRLILAWLHERPTGTLQ
jgi:hypothetical protein